MAREASERGAEWDRCEDADEHPPRLVYDDECGFCTWSARCAARRGAFELVGFSELTPDQEARLPEDYEDCAHLLTDGAVYSCGEATERTLRRMYPALDVPFSVLERVPGYPAVRERAYRWVADRRALWGRVLSACPPATEGC